MRAEMLAGLPAGDVFVQIEISEERWVRRLKVRLARLRAEAADAGMSTAEYAVATLAAVAFAGVLFKVVTSPKVQAELSGIIEKALN